VVRVSFLDANEKLKSSEEIYINSNLSPGSQTKKTHKSKLHSEKYKLEVISANAEIIK